MKKKKRETIRISKEELDKNYLMYFELSNTTNIEVIYKGKVIFVFDKSSYKRYKALKTIREIFRSRLKTNTSDF